MTKTERDLTDGRRLQDAGEFVKAEAIYNRVLKREPTNIHARFFLGALKTQTGLHNEAVKILELVVAERPNWEEAHNNLAVALHYLGRFAEALKHYQRASEINPDFADAHSNTTYLLQLLKRNEAALVSVDRALELQPDHFDSLINRAVILTALGRSGESRSAVIKASEHMPKDRETWVRVAIDLTRVDEYDRAIAIFEDVIETYPDYAPGYNLLTAALQHTITPFNRKAVQLRMLGLMDKCVEVDPDYLDGQINRATMLQRLRRNAEAKEILDTVAGQAKDRLDVANNYAALLQESGNFDEAIEYCKRAIAISDTYAEPYYNWGACLQLQGRSDEALLKYELALQRNPNHIDVHSALALLYLDKGDFERGWAEYEWRKQTGQFSGRLLPMNFLNPKKLAGQRILLHAEQGQGDMFQFMRYAHVIKAYGGQPFIECHDGLREVMKTCPWVDDVRERSDPQNLVFDQQANLLSLPFIFKTTLDTIPSDVPYLHAPEEYRPKWSKRIAELTPEGTRLKVGIAWAGNPDHFNDKQRSTTLEKFGALAGVPGITFFSLQKGGKAEEQLDSPPDGITVIALGPEISSFSDTAAILENLDLVIAVDTSVVHLAGAMGIPVWTMLPVGNDFRWMRDRTDSPWYPTMRLFRQRAMWDFDYVFEQVAAELERYASDPALWQIDEASAKFDRGLRTQAKVQLLALNARFGGDVRVVNTIGEFLWLDGNTQEALQAFLAALQIAPTDRRTIANTARVLEAFGRKSDAQAIFQNYMSNHPDDDDFAEALSELRDDRVLAAA